MKVNVSARKSTIALTILLMVVIEAVSLVILGWETGFAAGLFIGGVVSIINYLIMAATTERMAETGKRGIFFLGFLLRLALYGVSFYFTVFWISLISGLGCGLGFLSSIISVMILNAIVPIIRNKRRKRSGADEEFAYEEPETDDEGNKRFVFIKDYSTTRYSGGRNIVTHKRFKKLKPRGEAGRQ